MNWKIWSRRRNNIWHWKVKLKKQHIFSLTAQKVLGNSHKTFFNSRNSSYNLNSLSHGEAPCKESRKILFEDHQEPIKIIKFKKKNLSHKWGVPQLSRGHMIAPLKLLKIRNKLLNSNTRWIRLLLTYPWAQIAHVTDSSLYQLFINYSLL